MPQAISQAASPQQTLAILSQGLGVKSKPRLVAKRLKKEAKARKIDSRNPQVIELEKLRRSRTQEYNQLATSLGLTPRQVTPVQLLVAQQILAQANQPKEQAAASGQSSQSQPPATLPMQPSATSRLKTMATAAFHKARQFSSLIPGAA